MAKAMDGQRTPGLPSGRRRTESEIELLTWWEHYRSKPQRGVGSIEVRDKSDGSNRYGIVPWDVSLRGERASVDVSVNEPEAVSQRYTYTRIGTRRQRDGRRCGNRKGQGPVV